MKPVLGNSIKVIVNGIESYGIFVTCCEDYTGLIHISEISDKYVKSVDEFVSLGDEIFAKIININEDDKHLDLSIKNFDYVDGDDNLYDNIDRSYVGFEGLKAILPKWIEENLSNHKK